MTKAEFYEDVDSISELIFFAKDLTVFILLKTSRSPAISTLGFGIKWTNLVGTGTGQS